MGADGHGHSHGNMSMEPLDYVIPPITTDSSYFTHEGYSNMILAHIILMTLSWMFALPISSSLMRLQCIRLGS